MATNTSCGKPFKARVPRGAQHARTKLHSVTAEKLCPLCQAKDGCSVGDDGRVLCRGRTGEQPGYRCCGPAKGDPQWTLYVRYDADGARSEQTNGTGSKPVDWQARAEGYVKNLGAGRREALAKALGLPVTCLKALPLIGYVGDNDNGTWTFPEVDAKGNVIGISRRFPDGQKRTMSGSKRGLTLPAGWRDLPGPLVIVEGPSDVLAMCAAGKLSIGRSSNTGGVDHLAALLADWPADRPIIVAGENDRKAGPASDWPGKKGAILVASVLSKRLGRPVLYAMPPADHKDARAYLTDRAKEHCDWKKKPAVDVECWRLAGDEFVNVMRAGGDEAPVDDGAPGDDRTKFCNFREEHYTKSNGSLGANKIGVSGPQLADGLRKITDGWPKRVRQLLFVRDGDQPTYLEQVAGLFAWIGRQLPQDTDKNPLRWGEADEMVTRSEFFATLQQTGEVYDAVEQFPHHPPLSSHYYIHPPLAGGDGSALRSLLARFSPATDFDADLIESFFMTLVAGVPPGGRPAFLFTAEEGDENSGRGIGKTSVAEMGALLVGGHVAVTPADDMSEIKTRLLSPASRGRRVLLLDNVKTLRFGWDELEALVTTAIISGKQNYMGEGRIPNTFTIAITINGASLSKDMAGRCVIVELTRPTYSGTWAEDTRAFIESNRWAILGDLVAKLQAHALPLARHSRWGAWENLVLARLPRPAETQQVIEERQVAVDGDNEDAGLVRQAFVADLERRKHNPCTENVFFPSAVVANIVADATGEKRPVNRASAYLKTLGIKELRKTDRCTDRGWTWWGPQATSTETVTLNPVGNIASFDANAKPWVVNGASK
jgi:hypothetical protein